MADRMTEIMELARAGDEDVMLLVESEIALQPDTPSMRMRRIEAYADEYADQFAPLHDALPDAILDKMADEAGF